MASPPPQPVLKTLPAVFPPKRTTTPEPWHHHLTIDLIAKVLSYTLFHPWVSWILVLCLRAQATPYTHTSMRIAMAWAFLMSLFGILGLINDRIAYGPAREVDLSEEVIVITGGASGLGALIAEVYGMRGANVVVLDVKEMSKDEQEEKGVVFMKCDVGDAGQVEAVGKRIVEEIGPPTILINNAGTMTPTPLLSLPTPLLLTTFSTNTLSHFHTLRTFLPSLLSSPRGATIVTLSSSLSHLGASSLSAYTSSKASLNALHASLRAELSQHPSGHKVKTILVTPGQLSTDMFAGVQTPSRFFAPVVRAHEVAGEIIRLIDAGRGGEVSMPLYARWVPVMGVLPVGLQVLLRRWSGVDTAVGKSIGGKED